jgi:hypothetical protein
MAEAQGINAKVYVPGENGQYKKIGGRSGLKRLLTLDDLIKMIKLQGLDEYTTNGLIELASRYPTQALPTFRRNINLMIQRVRSKRKLEQRGDENAKIEKDIEQKKCPEETGSEKGHEGPDVIEIV